MVMGTSHSEPIAKVRLETACRLGFAGPGSFSRSFMRLTRVQPIVHRRQRVADMREKRCDAGERCPAKAAIAP